jgi:hypothetical protein
MRASTSMMLLVAVLALGGGPAMAEGSNPAPEDRAVPAPDRAPRESSGSSTGPRDDAPKGLGEDGVIEPPATGDRSVVPPPSTGGQSMPVIPPPGTPGGDQQVQPR